MCWDAKKASKLPDIVASEDFELHPVSGEVEFKDDEPPLFRRLDEETLQAKLMLNDLGLDFVYTWCAGDQAGGGDGWRLGEMRPVAENEKKYEAWYRTMTVADQSYYSSTVQDALREVESDSHGNHSEQATRLDEGSDDDDAYWRQYDSTPSRTPGPKASPGPSGPRAENDGRQGGRDDLFYARYNRVQPAMDSHDPAEDVSGLGSSTLNGDTLQRIMGAEGAGQNALDSRPTSSRPPPYNDAAQEESRQMPASLHIDHPRPSSSNSSNSNPVSRLEDSAEAQSQSEVGIKHHISTTMKSLYRLARTAGIEQDEFERLVKMELDVLSMMDHLDS